MSKSRKDTGETCGCLLFKHELKLLSVKSVNSNRLTGCKQISSILHSAFRISFIFNKWHMGSLSEVTNESFIFDTKKNHFQSQKGMSYDIPCLQCNRAVSCYRKKVLVELSMKKLSIVLLSLHLLWAELKKTGARHWLKIRALLVLRGTYNTIVWNSVNNRTVMSRTEKLINTPHFQIYCNAQKMLCDMHFRCQKRSSHFDVKNGKFSCDAQTAWHIIFSYLQCTVTVNQPKTLYGTTFRTTNAYGVLTFPLA